MITRCMSRSACDGFADSKSYPKSYPSRSPRSSHWGAESVSRRRGFFVGVSNATVRPEGQPRWGASHAAATSLRGRRCRWKKTDSPVMKHGWEIPELNGGFHGKVIYKWRINRLTCVYRDICIIYDNNVYIHTYTSTYTYTYIGR